MLGEDSYVPFPYFYDVTAWSLPLIANVAGGRSGEPLAPKATVVAPQTEPAGPAPPDDTPAVGVWQMSDDSTAVESSGWLRWLLTERWQVPFRELDGKDIRGGGLAGVEVLLVPDGNPRAGEKSLSTPGARELRGWLADGGRLVGWAGGTELSARLATTTARLREPTSDVPGSLLRVGVDRRSPLSAGVGDDAWMFYEYDPVMEVTDRASAPVRYPDRSGADWFVSGFARVRASCRTRHRSWMRRTRTGGWCCSRASRTSAASPTAPSSCCGTRCWAATPHRSGPAGLQRATAQRATAQRSQPSGSGRPGRPRGSASCRTR